MPNVVCPQCEKSVSDEAINCPHCRRQLAPKLQIQRDDDTFITEYPERPQAPRHTTFEMYVGSTRYQYDSGTGVYLRARPNAHAPSASREKLVPNPEQGIRVGLVIDEPWITMIAGGEKTWEMRSRATTKLERIALIKKGSGLIVCTAIIKDIFGPLTDSEIISNFTKHRVPIDKIGKWRYAWVLDKVARLARPIPYSHRKGAVTWVRLDSTAVRALVSAGAV